jgi:hypothetical protein
MMLDPGPLLEAAADDDTARAGTARHALLREAERLADPARDAERAAVAARLAAELVAMVPAPPGRTNVPELALPPEVPRHPAVVRRLLCRLLVLVAGGDEVPALAAALADPEMRDAARGALEVLPGLAATRALVTALGHPGGRFRAGVVRSLATKRDREAMSTLVALAAREADPDVRLAAIDGAARFPEPAIDDVLARLTREGTPRERARALVARVRLADTLRSFGDTTAAAAIERDIAAPTR